MPSVELREAVEDVKQAKAYLDSVRKRFADNPDLLSLYEPSARFIYKIFKDRLMEALNVVHRGKMPGF
ncbi:hypothetical protein Desku_0769 [Desulfofundulus kuznetsovii DSM 6115]|uniref:HEPN domain-containing protein n=1 Tax=Desulfofundulus kuznetsovii (strain DSM 6115 / VKM B-1805 / 17) TaxID=760568 RepID=A0AAU8PAW8_DESK7|nr:hypothetical protein Desku_0769 [Desulfofundulus kuznetsovii DSM 6115]